MRIETSQYELDFADHLLEIKYGKRKAEKEINTILNTRNKRREDKLSALIYLRLAVDKVFDDIAEAQGFPKKGEQQEQQEKDE